VSFAIPPDDELDTMICLAVLAIFVLMIADWVKHAA